METETRLRAIISEMNSDLREDDIAKAFAEALKDFKEMVEQGMATPRGNQQEDIAARHTFVY